MNAKEYVEFVKENSYIAAGSDAHRSMHLLARNARKITAKINGKYLPPEKIYQHPDLLLFNFFINHTVK